MSSTSDEKKQQLKNELKGMVDLLVDGPGEDQDAHAMLALRTVGRIMGAASWAFDHEMERVKSGQWRDPTGVGLDDDRLPQDERGQVGQDFLIGNRFTAKEVRGWQQLGREGWSPDENLTFLADTIQNLALGSGDPRFGQLAIALHALEWGEVMPLLKKRSGTIGRGLRGHFYQSIMHRKRAILGTVYQFQKRKITTEEKVSENSVLKEIAPFYGTDPDTMRMWKPEHLKKFGEVFEQEISMAALMGITAGYAGIDIGKDIPDEFAKSGEREYGIDALKKDGERYKLLQRS